MKEHLTSLVKKANAGDKKSLELIIIEIKDLVYNLSLKMLLFPEDAKDATQEILIKIVTRLSTFNHQSQFKTWVYRVATNYLLTHKGKQAKRFTRSFDDYATLIDIGQSDTVTYATNEGELALLEEEVKVSCTQGLLLCLSEIDRIVYILSDILEFNGVEGAEIVEITPENFRKKLSRSRAKIKNFLTNKCGLVNPNNPCRCKKKIDSLIDQSLIDPTTLKFASYSNRSIDMVAKLSDLEKSVAIYRSTPQFPTPDVLLKEIKETLAINIL